LERPSIFESWPRFSGRDSGSAHFQRVKDQSGEQFRIEIELYYLTEKQVKTGLFPAGFHLQSTWKVGGSWVQTDC
jgi:hypothetical protein